MREKIIIIGAGGHAKVVAECVDETAFEIVGFLDKDNAHLGEKIGGIPIIGNDSDLMSLKESGINLCVNGIGHIGDCGIRNRICEQFINAGFRMVTAIHKNSIVSKNAIVEDGVVIMPGAVVNSGARIMKNAIVNSNAVVEHDVLVGEGTHIAPGCSISGGVKIGKNALIGVGSSIVQSVTIGDHVIIGAGTVVTKDVPENVLVVGNPSRIIRKVR